MVEFENLVFCSKNFITSSEGAINLRWLVPKLKLLYAF